MLQRTIDTGFHSDPQVFCNTKESRKGNTFELFGYLLAQLTLQSDGVREVASRYLATFDKSYVGPSRVIRWIKSGIQSYPIQSVQCNVTGYMQKFKQNL